MVDEGERLSWNPACDRARNLHPVGLGLSFEMIEERLAVHQATNHVGFDDSGVAALALVLGKGQAY